MAPFDAERDHPLTADIPHFVWRGRLFQRVKKVGK
jgi:hypothetical protein